MSPSAPEGFTDCVGLQLGLEPQEQWVHLLTEGKRSDGERGLQRKER